MAAWWEAYLGKPWARIPDPPHSYTCGELCRAVLYDRFGITTPGIFADAGNLRQCVGNLDVPDLYDLVPVQDQPRPFDLAFLVRTSRRDHIGIAVATGEGMMIMHCQQGVGVILDSPADLLGLGYRRVDWHRHRDVTEEMARCRA